ncbi:MAG: hypothetical protein ACXU86_08415 [Archangium sp.]
MATRKGRRRSEEEIPFDLAHGGKAPPESVGRRGMADLEHELVAHFERELKRIEDARKLQARLQRPLRRALEKDADLAQVRRSLQEQERRAGKQQLQAPRAVEDRPRIFTGSIGAARTPPFDYGWRWSSLSGGAQISTTARLITGDMSFTIGNNSHESAGKAAVALGIYLRPITESSVASFFSTPFYDFMWWDYCFFDFAYSDGWLGLYVARYKLDGTFDGALVNQQLQLWADSSWFMGAGYHADFDRAFPLFARFQVDRSHYYLLWVWAGGMASSAGWDSFAGSGASSNLWVRIPSMTWQLS